MCDTTRETMKRVIERRWAGGQRRQRTPRERNSLHGQTAPQSGDKSVDKFWSVHEDGLHDLGDPRIEKVPVDGAPLDGAEGRFGVVLDEQLGKPCHWLADKAGNERERHVDARTDPGGCEVLAILPIAPGK
jgi:hypothetical protein